MVSVVIPAYNCERYVREAIDSVLAQTFTEFELIVVNDAATDGTADILREYEGMDRVRIVAHETNRGLSAARNSGIAAARGDYVTFLDADDVWRPEKLAYQVAILKEKPHLALLGNAEVNFFDGDQYVFPPLPEKPELHALEWEKLLRGSCGMSPSNAIMRKECFSEVGGFDTELRAAEDRDQWLRIVSRFDGAVASGIVNAYRLHHTNMSSDPERMRRNKKAVLQKAFRQVPCPAWIRARAYAHLHLDISITCYEADQRFRACLHLVKSFLIWPLPLGHEVRTVPLVRWVWAAKVTLGRKMFERLWSAMREGD